MSPLRIAALMLMLFVAWPSASASAQLVGIFRWQLQPYCNLITLTVSQQSGIYTLHGTDNRCGFADPASVVGVAFPSTGGMFSFGMTTVMADGTPMHTQAKLSIAAMSGTWRDSAGNSGTFAFTTGSGTGGAPRQIPSGGLAPGSVTTVQIAPGAVRAAQIAPNNITGAHIADGSLTFADFADAPRVEFDPSPGNFEPLPADATVVRSVTMTAPAAGKVLLSASAEVQFAGAATKDQVRCSISKTAQMAGANRISEAEPAHGGFTIYATTQAFNVAAGTATFNLVCEASNGTINLRDASLTALFAPSS